MNLLSRLYKPWFIRNSSLVFKAILFDLGFLKIGWVKTTTCFDSIIWVDNTKSIGRIIYKNGVYELPTSELIWRLLSKDSVFVDVGANIGYYSLLAAAKIGNKGRIDAFEPMPDIFEWLKKRVLGS